MKEQIIEIPAFFTQSQHVWVSENFQNLILNSYVPSTKQNLVKPAGVNLQDIPLTISSYELLFRDVDEFLEQLALLIDLQIRGESDALLNDSSANYFFVQGKDSKFYSILVRWEPAQRLWRCGAYLQETLQLPSVRVFTPN